DFAEFEIMPDPNYIDKILNTHKKFARIYKNNDSLPIFGYLLPFKLHAHPQVQKFIWDCGIGLYTNQGYGMVDIVGGAPAESTDSSESVDSAD
ncbi:MAG: CRISPR-associated endoribonuclease Cas6, partial [Bacteroidota bacterium]